MKKLFRTNLQQLGSPQGLYFFHITGCFFFLKIIKILILFFFFISVTLLLLDLARNDMLGAFTCVCTQNDKIIFKKPKNNVYILFFFPYQMYNTVKNRINIIFLMLKKKKQVLSTR